MSAVPTDAPLPGLTDPVGDAQRIFRRVLDALAHPGRVVTLDAPAELPAGVLGRAAIGTALALLDFETAIWLDEAAGPIGPHLRFHCNCPIVAARNQAAFGLIGDPATVPPLEGFALGSDSYPDRSATLVIEIGALDQDGALRLSGPGIADQARLGVIGLRAGFWQERAALAPLFPCGLDLILACGDRLAAIPRTTAVEVSGAEE